LVVPCALCFSRLKFAQHEVQKDQDLLMPGLKERASGMAAVEVVELNRFLCSPDMIARISHREAPP
jgi:hypothetical protein